MANPPESPEPATAPPRGCAVRLLGAVVVIAGLGMLGWYVYDRLLAAGGSGEVPLIEADDGPTKIRPENPGGLVVPNQDKLVYETLDGEAAEEAVERLLPAPEEPLPQPEPAVEAPVAAPEVAPAAQPADIPPLPPAEITPEAGLATAPAATAAVPPPPEPAPVVEAPAPEPESQAAVAGAYLVQLASFRETAEADKAWRQLAKKHGDLLSDYTARVERADLGAELGVFYRLRVGPFAGEAAAAAFCEALKSRHVDCLVVRP